jgi:CheY-like chemotaxis protein
MKIAIVDDVEDLGQMISIVLQKLGYPSPSVFHDGTSLVRALMIDHASFDVILMDYRMPEMDGIEAAKIIQRYRKDVKIVIFSAYDFVKEKASEIGIPFLVKPFSMEQLAECLNKLESTF